MRSLWIEGQGHPGSGGSRQVINPANEEVVAEVAWGTAAEADRAVGVARRAFESWRRVPVPEKTEMLHEAARRLRQNADRIATELTLETGRTKRKNLGYVEWSAQALDYYAELARNQRGRVISSPEASQLSLVLKVPLGVV
ncbi:MAG: aldehyde dehydrogenase family protein, partial [Chloroflexota bacterium]